MLQAADSPLRRPLGAAARRSLRLHARWIAEAVSPGAHPAAPLTPRRAMTLAAMLPPYAALQATHLAAFALDTVLYPREARTDTGDPLFVLGIPRSGTTFVHRLLAADEGRFTTMRTWEAVLAPSVSERRFWQAAGRADALLGAPGRRLRDALIAHLGGDFDAIHETGADAAEEDYLALLPLAGCFIMALAFPDNAALWQLGALDREPDPRTRALLPAAYRRLLQKHRYASGDGRQLLSKNAAFASWAGALAETFPRARFIVCLREPASALSSQISAVEPGRRLFAVDPDRRWLSRRFAEIYAGAYRHLDEQLAAHPDRMVAVDMADLRAAPGPTLKAALAHLDIPVSRPLASAFASADAAAGGDSRHRHDTGPGDAPPRAMLAAMEAAYSRMRSRAARPVHRTENEVS